MQVGYLRSIGSLDIGTEVLINGAYLQKTGVMAIQPGSGSRMVKATKPVRACIGSGDALCAPLEAPAAQRPATSPARGVRESHRVVTQRIDQHLAAPSSLHDYI